MFTFYNCEFGSKVMCVNNLSTDSVSLPHIDIKASSTSNVGSLSGVHKVSAEVVVGS